MDGPRGRVLVIEDDERLANLIRLVLVRDHEPVVLTSAQAAIERIEAGDRFDLILCDLLLPQVTGMEFHERVGLLAPELLDRIVFVTGGACSSQAAAFLGRVENRALEKPFGLTKLEAVVREHLGRAL